MKVSRLRRKVNDISRKRITAATTLIAQLDQIMILVYAEHWKKGSSLREETRTGFCAKMRRRRCQLWMLVLSVPAAPNWFSRTFQVYHSRMLATASLLQHTLQRSETRGQRKKMFLRRILTTGSVSVCTKSLGRCQLTDRSSRNCFREKLSPVFTLAPTTCQSRGSSTSEEKYGNDCHMFAHPIQSFLESHLCRCHRGWHQRRKLWSMLIAFFFQLRTRRHERMQVNPLTSAARQRERKKFPSSLKDIFMGKSPWNIRRDLAQWMSQFHRFLSVSVSIIKRPLIILPNWLVVDVPERYSHGLRHGASNND